MPEQQSAAPLAPLLKWPGGKRALLPNLVPFIPRTYGCYYEPFLGGAALFFHLRPSRATLSDLNGELIECYTEVRDHPEAVLAHLRDWKNNKTEYGRVRRTKYRSSTKRAAQFLYLTTLSFNGIYRVNQDGKFNVPYGHKRHISVTAALSLEDAAHALKNATLKAGDFETTLAPAQSGDLIYLDPPYTVAHGNNGFVKYNARIFSWKDQARLADVARELVKRGCHVVISNASHSSIHSLYSDFSRTVVSRQSRVAASASARRLVDELIMTGCTGGRK